MRVNRWFLCIFCLYVLIFFSHALFLKKTVYGDGIFYYSWVRSMVIDQDVRFDNEYDYFGVVQPRTPTGLSGNKYSIGSALFWLPPFAWTHVVGRGTGYSLPYQLAVGFASVLSVLTGLLLLFRLLTKIYSDTIALLTILSVALATNLLFYGSVDPVNSHSISFFAVTVFLSFLLTQKSPLLIGFTLGLLGSIRTNDLVYGILLLPLIRRKTIVPVASGVVLGFAPQLLAWQALYKTFLTSPYLTGGEGFDLTHPHILEVLFSPKNGLFLWTPLLILGFIGILLLFFSKTKYLNNIYYYSKARRGFSFQTLVILTLIVQIFIVSTWSTWWQGASYSGRMFVSTLPLFALGLAHIYQNLAKRGWDVLTFLLALVGPLSIINILFILFFLIKT